ncbi:MAG TPA: TVP38/TMEM64 family protein [Stellaceae bacterium]|jgi:uncharacterized membrane protein YdjX (TVP38/TMEM64 family)|nr:TVP38/TMEM64 family protein [Stellaceae bacterium]
MTQLLSHLPLSDSQTREQLRRLGPWIGLALVLFALCLAWLLLPLHQWMDALQGWFKGRSGWGVAIFALALFVATFLPMPDWPLPIVAGYVYGVWAFPLVYVGVSVPSILAFLAARHLARDRIRTFLAKRPKYRSIDKAVGAGGWKVVALLRLSPMVPFNLQNYALGVTAISFSQYLVGTFLGITPGVAIYVYFGIFGYGLSKGPGALDWILLSLGVVATIVLGVIVTGKTGQLFEASERRRR